MVLTGYVLCCPSLHLAQLAHLSAAFIRHIFLSLHHQSKWFFKQHDSVKTLLKWTGNSSVLWCLPCVHWCIVVMYKVWMLRGTDGLGRAETSGQWGREQLAKCSRSNVSSNTIKHGSGWVGGGGGFFVFQFITSILEAQLEKSFLKLCH